MQPLFFTLARIVVALMMFYAVAKNSYNYYVLLRWLVFAVAIWSFYRAIKSKDPKLILFFLILGIVFNPMRPMYFDKSTWTAIDIGFGIFVLLSIFILDSEPIDKFYDSKVGDKIFSIVITLFCIGLVLIGLFVFYAAIKGAVRSIRLYNGQQAKARILTVEYRLEVAKHEEGEEIYDAYYVNYEFETNHNETIKGSTILYKNPINKELEVDEIYTPKEPAFIDVKYQESNPDHNEAVERVDGYFSIGLEAAVILLFGYLPLYAGIKGLKQIFIEDAKSA